MKKQRIMRLLAGLWAAVLFALPLTGCQGDAAGESDPLSRPASADAEDGVLWDEVGTPAEGETSATSTFSTKKAAGASESERADASFSTPAPTGAETPTTQTTPSTSTAFPDGGTTTASSARPGGVTTVPPIDDSGFGPIVKP